MHRTTDDAVKCTCAIWLHSMYDVTRIPSQNQGVPLALKLGCDWTTNQVCCETEKNCEYSQYRYWPDQHSELNTSQCATTWATLLVLKGKFPYSDVYIKVKLTSVTGWYHLEWSGCSNTRAIDRHNGRSLYGSTVLRTLNLRTITQYSIHNSGVTGHIIVWKTSLWEGRSGL
jgi:hypothetical protein